MLGRRRRPDLPRTWPAATRPAAASSRSRPPTRPPTVAADPGKLPGAHRPQRLDPRRPARGAGRSSTAPSPRPRRATSPTDRAAPPTWRTRPAPATSWCSPTRRTSSTARDAGHAGGAVALLRPARLRPRRPGPRRQRQHARHLPGRRRGDRRWQSVGRALDRSRADAGLSCSQIPRAAAEPGARPAGRSLEDDEYHAADDRRAERLPRPARSDHDDAYDGARTSPVGGAAQLATMFDEDARGAAQEGACCWPAATTSAPRRRTRPCSRTCRRSTSRTPGAWTPPRTATTSSTTASSGCSSTRRGPTSRSWASTSSTTATDKPPSWVTAVEGLPGQRR